MGAEMVFNYRQPNDSGTVSSLILAPPRFPAQMEAKGITATGSVVPAHGPCLGRPSSAFWEESP